jgi:putative membrane protein
VETPQTPLFLVASGAIAICAMVLPGISGSFILVLLGKYQQVLSAVTQRDLFTLAMVAVGAGIGIVAFARVLSWLLGRFHDVTIALLIGLMAGSLRKVWPWKEVLATVLDRHGEAIPVVERNVLPSAGSGLAAPIALAVLGLLAVLAMEAAAGRGTATAAGTSSAGKR